MTLRSRDKYAEAAWDWGIFRGCFGRTTILPSDVDGIVERKGRLLLIEAKPRDRIGIDDGQAQVFSAAVALGITVIVLYGDRNKPAAHDGVGSGQLSPVQPRRRSQFVADWFAEADRGSLV